MANLLPLALSVAVIAWGDDAGPMQTALEQAVGVETLADVSPLVRQTRPPLPRKVDRKGQRTLKRLVDQIKDAYYDGDLDGAEALMTATAKVLRDQRHVPATNLVEFNAWRVTVYLAQKKGAAADAAARDALTLHPDLVIDLNEFSPIVADRFAIAKQKLRWATITLVGLPNGASVWIDDRAFDGGTVKVPHGKHRLTVWAPGRRTFERYVKVNADRRVRASLALALAKTPTLDSFDAMAKTLSVDRMLLSNGSRVWYWQSGTLVDETVSSPQAANRWASKLVQKPAIDPPTRRGPSELVIAADGALVLSLRSRVVDWDDCSGDTCPETRLAGGGPRVNVNASYGRFLGQAHFDFLNYDLSRVNVTNENATSPLIDSEFEVRGGSTFSGGLLVGTEWPVRRFTVQGLGGFYYETHRADDVVDGTAVGILPSHTYLAAELRGVGRARFGDGWTGTVSGLWRPFGSWEESPRNVTGRRPSPSGLGWSAEASRAWGDTWTLTAALWGRYAFVSFEGRANSRLDPIPDEATSRESTHGLSVMMGRAF